MSADNTIAILTTRGKRRRVRGRGGRWVTKYGTEYRVAHCQAVEVLFEETDYPIENPRLNLDHTHYFFGKCEVVTDLGLALKKAKKIQTDIGYAEYGIKFFEFPNLEFPKNLRAPQSRQFQRRASYA